MSGPVEPLVRDIPLLLAEIERRRDLRHRWRRGQCCVSSAFACVEAQTGIDWLADIAPWASRKEALAVARELGGLRAILDARLQPVAPALAQRGDVAGLPDDLFGVRLMIVEGATLGGPGRRGWDRLPRTMMIWAGSAVSQPEAVR